MPRIVILALTLVLGACASQPEPPPPTVVQLHFQAAPDLNPAPGGQPSPVRVRLYELKSGSTFGRADYFPLVEAADATLAGDLVAQDEVLVAPGAELQVDRTLDEQTRLIGLIVAYRELDRSVWRHLVAIPAQQRSQLKVRLDAHGVSASLTPGQ